jgi:prolyl-tRNA editing enzyme YbaK/EbsC (Cys-tRNA(Pro) deacylase)
VFCDVSLKAFDEVFPAAGASDAAVRLTPARLAELTHGEWVDVAQDVGVAVA